jgi:hypothetical protein
MGRPLILGSVDKASPSGCLFDRALGDILPAFKEIEGQLFLTGTIPDDAKRSEVEAYRPASGHWEPITASLISGPTLVRGRDQYSGWSLYIQHSEVGLRLRITQPEWAFIIAYHLLPWQIEDLFTVRGCDIEIYRTVRLPALLLRTIFAAASAVSIGPKVLFRDVHESCVSGVLSYFALARGLTL